jgi:hypothetical protein
MTVRGSIDQLIAEPPVADLGYPADQRLVATVVMGLKLLADSIDDLEARLAHMPESHEVVTPNLLPAEMHDITAEIHDINEQVGKLAKIIKKVAKEK